MKKYILLMGLTMGIVSLAACDYGPKSSKGFKLPDGDAEIGQMRFVQFKCNDCHSIEGKGEIREDVTDPIMTVPLGGKTTRILTYGQLVTSIINPSHKISHKYLVTPVEEDGHSKMRNYNDLMTVEDLINIVAFLQQQYVLEPFDPTYYPVYTSH